MVVELDPGTDGRAGDRGGRRIPVGQTQPDVNLDEVLAALDGDTRLYLQALLNAGAEGLDGRGEDLGDTFRQFEPTARALKQINGALAKRRGNIKRAIHNFSPAVGGARRQERRDRALRRGLQRRAVRAGRPGGSIRETLRELPSALSETGDALEATDELAAELGPALGKLRPAARRLGPDADAACSRSCATTTPMLRDEIRPLVRPPTRWSTSCARRCATCRRRPATSSPRWRSSTACVDMLAYNPPGVEEGYLFWFSWVNHLGASLFNTADAHGPIRRGILVANCNALDVIDSVAQVNPQLGVVIGLINIVPRVGRVPERGDERLMQKTGMKPSQIAIMATFALSCFGLLLFLWLAFGGAIPLKPKGYRINASFNEATTLAIEADVRISGVRVGKVKTIEPNKTTGRSDVVIEIESDYAPSPADAKATLRQKTLLGETYVELTPGTEDGPKIPEEGTIAGVADRRLGAARRDLPRVRPEDARGLPDLDAGAGDRDRRPRRGPQRGARQPRPVRRGRLPSCSASSAAQQPAVQQLVSNTGTVFEALQRARRPAARR